MKMFMKAFENTFETLLFNTRFITIFGVFGTLVSSFVMFAKGTMLIINGICVFYKQVSHFNPGEEHGIDVLVTYFIAAVDNYLFATVLLIFSMGLYELFISEIDPAGRKKDTRPNWLKIKSLDDLKSSLGKVILMILIVSFFEQSLNIEYKNAIDLLCLGAGTILVAGALFLTHLGHKQ